MLWSEAVAPLSSCRQPWLFPRHKPRLAGNRGGGVTRPQVSWQFGFNFPPQLELSRGRVTGCGSHFLFADGHLVAWRCQYWARAGRRLNHRRERWKIVLEGREVFRRYGRWEATRKSVLSLLSYIDKKRICNEHIECLRNEFADMPKWNHRGADGTSTIKTIAYSIAYFHSPKFVAY